MSEEMKFNVFIKGKNVDLVVLDEEAVGKTDWFNWFNDEENTRYMKHRYYPNNRAKQLAFYKNEIENNPKKLQVGIFHKEDKVLIGVISLNNIDFLNRNCNTGAIIGVKKYRKIFCYLEAYTLLLKHAFEQLNMNKISDETLSKDVADFLIKTVGFKMEGVRRGELYKNGKYVDLYLIGLLKEEFYKGGYDNIKIPSDEVMG
jgi:RimJ/RimL family protein N-acetyltransferase